MNRDEGKIVRLVNYLYECVRMRRFMMTWHYWLSIYTRGASDSSGGPGVN
jgi:hypothetical protein